MYVQQDVNIGAKYQLNQPTNQHHAHGAFSFEAGFNIPAMESPRQNKISSKDLDQNP
jgi:hypothetical protein